MNAQELPVADALPNHYWIQSLLITKVSLGFSIAILIFIEFNHFYCLWSPIISFFFHLVQPHFSVSVTSAGFCCVCWNLVPQLTFLFTAHV